jgi:hypothetical protein
MKNFNGRPFFSCFFIARANQKIRILALGRASKRTLKHIKTPSSGQGSRAPLWWWGAEGSGNCRGGEAVMWRGAHDVVMVKSFSITRTVTAD